MSDRHRPLCGLPDWAPIGDRECDCALIAAVSRDALTDLRAKVTELDVAIAIDVQRPALGEIELNYLRGASDAVAEILALIDEEGSDGE